MMTHTLEQPKNNTYLRISKYLFLIFILFTVIIIVGSTMVYQSFKMNLRTEISEQLFAISELKVSQMTQWRNERIADGRIFYKNIEFSALVKRYMQSNNDRDAKRSILTWMGQIQNAYPYNLALLLDPQLNSLIQYPENTQKLQIIATQQERDSILSGNIVFQDFYRNNKDSEVYLKLLIPIQEEHFPNRVIAVMMLRISPEQYLFPHIKQWPVPSKTSETLIIRKDSNFVTFLNDLRFYNNASLNLTIPLTQKDVLAVRAVTGSTGTVEGIDYRGQKVCGYVRSIPNSPWFIVAKTDIEEAFAPLNEKLWQIIIFAIVLFICGGAGISFMYRIQQNLFYKEQLQLVEDVKISEMRYRRLFEAARDGILILDAETGMVVDVNPYLIELLGLTKEEFLNRKVWELGFLNDAIANEDNFKELKEKGYVRYEDMAMEAHNGERREVEFVSNVYMVNNKKVIQCNIRDISERKRLEEETKQEQSLGKTIVDSIPGTFYVLDENGRYIRWNAYQRDEIVGKSEDLVAETNAADTIHPDDRALIQSKIANVLVNGVDETIEGRVLLRGGPAFRWLVMTGRRIMIKGRPYLVGIGIDITDRKQAEAALRESEKEFRLLAETMPQIVWITRPDGWNIFFNQQWVDYTGQTLEESYGHGWIKPFHPNDQQSAWDAWKNATKNGAVYSLECRLRRADGVYTWWLIRGVPIVDSQGTILKWFGTCTDINEFKQAEEALRKSEQTYRSLVNAIPDTSISLFDTNMRYQIVDGGEFEKNNIDKSHIEGRTLFEVYPTDVVTMFEPLYKKALHDEPTTFEMSLGNFVYSQQVLPVKDEKGNIIGAMTISTNITERKRAEEEIKRQLDELFRWHNATLGRESRILDLKREVNELLSKTGDPPRYPSAESQDKKEE